MTSWGESYNSVRWIRRTQCSFWETFFSVFILGYFPFRHNPLSVCNITLQIPQEQSQWMASCRESCNCVRWINRTQSSFSESFFSVFILGYFPFCHNPLSVCNITLQIPQEQSQWMASWWESCNCVRWINRTQTSFSEIFFPIFNRRYFLFRHSPLWASKYHFANSTRTVLAKGFLKGKL